METNAKSEPNTLQNGHLYMTRQGGPKTLPAAFWQAILVRRLLQLNTGAAAGRSGDRRQLIEQPICHRKRLKNQGKTRKLEHLVVSGDIPSEGVGG
jgi:hypothetical protein